MMDFYYYVGVSISSFLAVILLCCLFYLCLYCLKYVIDEYVKTYHNIKLVIQAMRLLHRVHGDPKPWEGIIASDVKIAKVIDNATLDIDGNVIRLDGEKSWVNDKALEGILPVRILVYKA